MSGLEEALEKIVVGKYDLATIKEEAKVHEKVHEYLRLAESEPIKARPLGLQLLEDAAKFTDLLEEMAWSILTDEDIKKPDFDLALQAAKAVNEAKSGKDPDALDTYALALFKNGKTAEAIKLEKQAIALCKDEKLMPHLKNRLAEFEGKGK